MNNHLKLEQRVSKLKMITGLEAEIVGNELHIKAGSLALSELDALVEYCHRAKLEYHIESTLIFKIISHEKGQQN